MSAPAYFFHGMTFCDACALRPTRVGFIICGYPAPETMDDAIATLVLMNATAGSDEEIPVAVNASGVCENCGQAFGPEVKEDVA